MPRRWPQRNRLGLPKRGRKKPVPLVVAAASIAILVVIIVFTAKRGEKEEELAAQAAEDASRSIAFVEALTRTAAASALASDFIDSGAAEKILEEQREEQARTAMWVEGEPMVLAGELRSGQSLYLALQERKVPTASVHYAVTAMGEEFNFRRSRPGNQWRAELDEEGRIVDLRYQTSPEDIWRTIRVAEGQYETEKLDIDIEVRHETLASTINSSFWLALEATGESGALAYNFMEVFQYTIDFNTETRQGDKFAMIFEKIYLDGEFLRYGRVLAAKYEGENAKQEAYFHQSDTESGYYTAAGESMQRQFLRSPLELIRVTSRFGRRVHPITGDSRLHRGVDFGAPTGTRVRAAANGRVHFAGRRGGYGNLIILRHSGGYETRYAHLSRFESGIRAGATVSQGQTIGRVGATGMATGPHLHYEMIQNGRHIDPFSIKSTSGNPLKGATLAAFKEKIAAPFGEQMGAALAELAPTKPEAVASAADDQED